MDFLETRYYNTLHGFQYMSSEDEYVIAYLPEGLTIEDAMDYVRKHTGSDTLSNGDWIGRDYISIKSQERHLIPEIVNSFCQFLASEVLDPPPKGDNYIGTFKMKKKLFKSFPPLYTVSEDGHIFGHHFNPGLTLVTRLMPHYKKDDRFSIERSEEIFLKIIEETSKIVEKPVHQHYLLQWFHARENNWKTEKGKELARAMIEDGYINDFLNDDEFDENGWYTKKIIEHKIKEDPKIDHPLSLISKH